MTIKETIEHPWLGNQEFKHLKDKNTKESSFEAYSKPEDLDSYP